MSFQLNAWSKKIKTYNNALHWTKPATLPMTLNVMRKMNILTLIKNIFLNKSKLTILGNIESLCPYCNNLLEKKPKKKTKCPHCSNYIFVRTRPLDNKKILIKDDQKELIKEQWAIKNDTHDLYLQERDLFNKTKKKLIQKNGHASDNDTKWFLLNQEGLQYANKHKWGLYRNTRFSMAEILNKEKKFKSALLMYFEVCYIDLNGPTNYGIIEDNDNNFYKDFPQFDLKFASLAPGVINRIIKIIENQKIELNEINNEILAKFEENYQCLKLPIAPSKAWEKIKKEI